MLLSCGRFLHFALSVVHRDKPVFWDRNSYRNSNYKLPYDEYVMYPCSYVTLLSLSEARRYSDLVYACVQF
jgi:hypothetical protein